VLSFLVNAEVDLRHGILLRMLYKYSMTQRLALTFRTAPPADDGSSGARFCIDEGACR